MFSEVSVKKKRKFGKELKYQFIKRGTHKSSFPNIILQNYQFDLFLKIYIVSSSKIIAAQLINRVVFTEVLLWVKTFLINKIHADSSKYTGILKP